MMAARKEIADVLEDLVVSTNLAVRTDARLKLRVDQVAEKDDVKRAKKGDYLRRKSELASLSPSAAGLPRLTPWHVLHNLAHALSLSRQGAGRGLAEHWGSLKYSQALDAGGLTYIGLSSEGKENVTQQYKRIQSQELGHGFARLLARHVLRETHPGSLVSIVRADVVIRAGWARRSPGYGYQPDFFAEIWRPGEPSRVIPIAAKGNHSRLPATSYRQLAAGSAHADAMVIGEWNQTPGLLFSTQLSPEGHLTIHALHARGKAGRLEAPDRPARRLNDPAEQKNLPLGIRVSKDQVEPGFHLIPQHFGWFQQVLARTAAAGAAAFAGDAAVAARYLTERQRNGDRGDFFAHAAAGSVRDACHRLLGMEFVGTDHVFRLNNERVEAFSGVETGLFDLLSTEEGGVEEYRKEMFARRGNWPPETWDASWGGPVSVQDDGTVLAIRVLPSCDH